MKKVLIDLNVILDFLNKKQHHREAAQLFQFMEEGEVEGFLAAHELVVLTDFLDRQFTSRVKTRETVEKLLGFLQVVEVDEQVIREALQSHIPDFEDAVSEAAARLLALDYIVTRDLKDYKKGAVPAISPGEFIRLLKNEVLEKMNKEVKPHIAQKEPYTLEMEPGQYWWCSCGRSKKQPFCDGSHKDTGLTPVEVTIEEAGTYYWCGCKHTKTPPFCDGSHRKLTEEGESKADV